MRKRAEIEIRMSEIREALNAEDAPENADQLKVEYRQCETEFRDVLKAEQEAETQRRAANPDDETGEGAEYRQLLDRVELRHYLQAAAAGRPVKGPENELAEALKLSADSGVILPWEVLEDRAEQGETEDRAITPAPDNVGRNQQGIVGRVFATTAAAHVGVRFPSVGVGEPHFVYVSGGNAAGFVAKEGAADETAGSFTTKTFSPKRLTASYRMAREDLAVLRGMESALRGDLRSALGEVLDKQIIGAGDAQVRGLMATAANGGLADVTNPTDAVTVALMEDTLLAPLDGRHARSEGDVRYLVGADSYRKLQGLGESGRRPFDKFKPRTQVSAHIPAQTNGKIQQGIAVTQRGPILVAPVWQGVEIIRDPYTSASKGEIVLTAIALYNFGIVRKDGATRLKFKLS